MVRILLRAAALLGVGAIVAACGGYSAGRGVSSQTYLDEAQAATRARKGEQAIAALNQAESAWLNGNAAYGNPIVWHEHPALRDIGLARAAVQGQNWKDAEYYIRAALNDPSVLKGG